MERKREGRKERGDMILAVPLWVNTGRSWTQNSDSKGSRRSDLDGMCMRLKIALNPLESGQWKESRTVAASTRVLTCSCFQRKQLFIELEINLYRSTFSSSLKPFPCPNHWHQLSFSRDTFMACFRPGFMKKRPEWMKLERVDLFPLRQPLSRSESRSSCFLKRARDANFKKKRLKGVSGFETVGQQLEYCNKLEIHCYPKGSNRCLKS